MYRNSEYVRSCAWPPANNGHIEAIMYSCDTYKALRENIIPPPKAVDTMLDDTCYRPTSILCCLHWSELPSAPAPSSSHRPGYRTAPQRDTGCNWDNCSSLNKEHSRNAMINAAPCTCTATSHHNTAYTLLRAICERPATTPAVPCSFQLFQLQ